MTVSNRSTATSSAGTDRAWLWVPGNADGGWSLWLVEDAPEPVDPDAAAVEAIVTTYRRSPGARPTPCSVVMLDHLRARGFDVTPRPSSEPPRRRSRPLPEPQRRGRGYRTVRGGLTMAGQSRPHCPVFDANRALVVFPPDATGIGHETTRGSRREHGLHRRCPLDVPWLVSGSHA